MAEKSIIKAEKNLTALKNKTDYKIWQYAILKEFIDLFGKNPQVLCFIASNYGETFFGLVDDTVLLSKEELAVYGENEEKSLEKRLLQLLNMS